MERRKDGVSGTRFSLRSVIGRIGTHHTLLRLNSLALITSKKNIANRRSLMMVVFGCEVAIEQRRNGQRAQMTLFLSQTFALFRVSSSR